MTRGPHVKGPGLVERLDGSELAKRKLRVVLETISGGKTVEEACQELAIGTTAFHELRAKVLEGAIELLEPKPPGRPPKVVPESEGQISELESEVRRLKLELSIAHVREEVLLSMPSVFQPAKAARKKKRERTKKRRAVQPRIPGPPAPGDTPLGAGGGDRAGEPSAPDGGEGTRG
jgi:transposase-like protein